MKIILPLVPALLLSHISATCTTVNTDYNITYQTRAADACADSSQAIVYVEAFLEGGSAHAIQPRYTFVDLDSVVGNDWQIQGEIFLAWNTAQEFTVPLYQLVNPTTVDYLFEISTDGNPPTVSGYNTEGIIGYVYSTQVCGSVPLLSTFQDTVGDHWYTTSASEQAGLIANGWTDAGIVGYVLPLTCGCSS